MSYMNIVMSAGRVSSPGTRSVAQNASPTSPAAIPAQTTPAARFSQNSSAMFFNLDGDSAEISNRARDLSFTPHTQRPVGPEVLYGPLPGSSPATGAPTKTPRNSDIPIVEGSELLELLEPEECHTCANRKYIDRSDDASVSYQTPTNISPNMAAAAVAAHEQEHVRNEQAKADRDGREIVNQSITLLYDVCPECGRNYVSGGVTRTTSVSKSDSADTPDNEMSTGNDNDAA